MQTNLFKARNGKVQGTEKRRDFADKLCLQMQTMGARFADKVCLKMQTNFADKPLQDTPPPNADKPLQKCRRARWGFGQIADELCRQRLSATRGGDACILVRLHNVAGVVYSEMQTRVVYSEMQTRFVYSYSTFVSSGGSCNLFTVSSTSSA